MAVFFDINEVEAEGVLARKGGGSSLGLSLPKAYKLANFFGGNFCFSVEDR